MEKYHGLILTILISCLILLGRCTSGSQGNDLESIQTHPSLIPPGIPGKPALDTGDHPLYDKMNAFLDVSKKTALTKPTGLNRNTYLQIIEGQVRAMKKYQNDEGRLIDPVDNVEKYYSTPCYAHSIAALVASSYIDKDDPLALSGMKALDASLDDMANAAVNGNHGDFYTWPVMFAYELFKPHVDKARLQTWDDKLGSIKISKLYATHNDSSGNNWVLVHTAGEFLRGVNGFTNFDYVEKMLGTQLPNFTKLGMYNEWGNPLPYDLFARHYLSGMLKRGYRGSHSDSLRKLVWKGAWTSLFMQSPYGELPTGYRSSHHIWNEAEQCVIFEIYASEYADLGQVREASIFKRAAMLSLSSVSKWIREDGSGYIVKNRYPIGSRHGYERYSVHTCYNMLACSMLAQAWQFANGSITEQAAPADIGGFVIPVLQPFHKIFANAGGTYLEYDTKGDQQYNPTGILRMHIKNSHPQLGPSDGAAPYYSGKGISIATGLSWLNANGTWNSLAEQRLEPGNVQVLYETTDSVLFRTQYKIDTESTPFHTVTISETIGIKNNIITIEEQIEGTAGRKRFSWPMLVFDGQNKIDVQLGDSSAHLSLDGKGVRFSVTGGEGIKMYRSKAEYTHRNGTVAPLFVDFDGNKITVQFQAL